MDMMGLAKSAFIPMMWLRVNIANIIWMEAILEMKAFMMVISAKIKLILTIIFKNNNEK